MSFGYALAEDEVGLASCWLELRPPVELRNAWVMEPVLSGRRKHWDL